MAQSDTPIYDQLAWERRPPRYVLGWDGSGDLADITAYDGAWGVQRFYAERAAAPEWSVADLAPMMRKIRETVAKLAALGYSTRPVEVSLSKETVELLAGASLPPQAGTIRTLYGLPVKLDETLPVGAWHLEPTPLTYGDAAAWFDRDWIS